MAINAWNWLFASASNAVAPADVNLYVTTHCPFCFTAFADSIDELVTRAGPSTNRSVCSPSTPVSRRSDVKEFTALELSGKSRNRGSGLTVFILKPAAEPLGTTPRFLAVSRYFVRHSGSAADLLKSPLAGDNGAKQRTARNVTPLDGFAGDADVATV